MKAITEMSEQEILSLTDEQLETLVKIRMAQEGIKILSRPNEPEYLPVPQPEITAYKVNGFDDYFLNSEDAQKASEFILSMKAAVRDLSYGQHYELKFLIERNESLGNIQPAKFYSKESAKQVEDSFTTNQKMKKEYDSELSDYKSNYDSAQYIRDEIYGKHEEVHAKHRNMERMKSKFLEYLPLAENDSSIAMNFLKKAYAIDEETEQFIHSNNTVAA